MDASPEEVRATLNEANEQQAFENVRVAAINQQPCWPEVIEGCLVCPRFILAREVGLVE